MLQFNTVKAPWKPIIWIKVLHLDDIQIYDKIFPDLKLLHKSSIEWIDSWHLSADILDLYNSLVLI